MSRTTLSFSISKSTLLITLVFLLFGFTKAVAQNKVTINGYIKDKTSGETLIQANVYLEESSQGTATNTSGYYTIPDILPGTYTLVVAYIGYQEHRQEVSVKPNDQLRLDIELQPTELAVNEIIVEGEQTYEEEKQVGRLTLPPAMIRELPSVLEDDLFRTIQLLPGVKSASDYSGGLYIRGGSIDQTLILLDRTTVYNPSHFFGFFSTFNPDAIKDVHIYKGGYPAEFGGRLGSVLDIYNRDGNRKEFQGKAHLGILASRINLEGPFKNGSWMLGVRRSTLEPVLAILRNSIDDIPETFYFYDINGKVNYDPGKNDRLNLAFYSGFDRVVFPFADDGSFDLNYGNRTLSTNWTHVFSQKLFSNFTLTASQYENTPELEINGTPIQRENRVEDFSVKGDFEYIPTENHEIKAGFWAGDLTLSVVDHFDGEETLNEKIESTYASAYVQEVWQATPLLQLKGGVRGNYFQPGDYIRLEPRVSAEYRYSQQMMFQAAFGRYYQFLTLISNEAFSGFDLWLTTDVDVPPAWGDQFILGIKTRPREGWTLDIEGYYRTMQDLFELEPRLQDAAGLDYAELFRFGEGFAYGAEFMLEKREGDLTGFVGYTWGTSRRKFAEYNDGLEYPPKYDRIHDLNLVLNYKLSPKWRVTSVFSYATGQAHTTVTGNYAIDPPTGSETLYPFIVGGLNASRLPAYHRLDVGFIRYGKLFGRDFELNLQAINLYSRRNIWFYSYDLNENPIVREDVQMLPLIPNVSFTMKF